MAVTRIGEYNVHALEVGAGIARYEGTHVVLPRRAIIELLEPAASRNTARSLLRRACILEALHHVNVPRVLECGTLDGRLWVAFERPEGVPLDALLRQRRLDIGEVLDLVEQVAVILAHAHARGVLHRHIVPRSIVLATTLSLAGWERVCTQDAAVAEDDPTAEPHADVCALGEIALHALAHLPMVPAGLPALLGNMVDDDATKRPTAAEVVEAVRWIREQWFALLLEPMPEQTLDEAIESLANAEPLPRERRSRWTPFGIGDASSARTREAPASGDSRSRH